MPVESYWRRSIGASNLTTPNSGCIVCPELTPDCELCPEGQLCLLSTQTCHSCPQYSCQPIANTTSSVSMASITSSPSPSDGSLGQVTSNNKNTLPQRALIGGIVGGVFFVLIVVWALYWLLWYRPRRLEQLKSRKGGLLPSNEKRFGKKSPPPTPPKHGPPVVAPYASRTESPASVPASVVKKTTFAPGIPAPKENVTRRAKLRKSLLPHRNPVEPKSIAYDTIPEPSTANGNRQALLDDPGDSGVPKTPPTLPNLILPSTHSLLRFGSITSKTGSLRNMAAIRRDNSMKRPAADDVLSESAASRDNGALRPPQKSAQRPIDRNMARSYFPSWERGPRLSLNKFEPPQGLGLVPPAPIEESSSSDSSRASPHLSKRGSLIPIGYVAPRTSVRISGYKTISYTPAVHEELSESSIPDQTQISLHNRSTASDADSGVVPARRPSSVYTPELGDDKLASSYQGPSVATRSPPVPEKDLPILDTSAPPVGSLVEESVPDNALNSPHLIGDESPSAIDGEMSYTEASATSALLQGSAYQPVKPLSLGKSRNTSGSKSTR